MYPAHQVGPGLGGNGHPPGRADVLVDNRGYLNTPIFRLEEERAMPVNAVPVNDASQAPQDVKRDVRAWATRQTLALLMLAAILFGAAGRIDWLWGWVFTGLNMLAVVAQAVIFIPRSPDLLAERSGPQPGTKRWDLAIAGLAAGLLPLTGWAVAGLDVRFGWPPAFAPWVQIAGAAACLLGYAIVIRAMLANAYFAATVRIQEERGHRVATGGPYRIVRHPGYVGRILFALATPLVLGSAWAFVPMGLAAALYVVRTALEDRTLRQELDDYEAYTRRVRYRLIPGIW
jgi:protein-S-isoprenylcysteine O-methyltransferase Ste14